jgi:chromosome partitioning protein
MRVWAVANQKGGVGKTTSVVGLAGLLAASGQRVLMFDLDPQGSLTSYFKYNPDELQHSSYNLFQHAGEVPAGLPMRLITRTTFPGLDFLPASTSLATLERQSVGQGGMGLVVRKSLQQLHQDYDYVLMDTPPVLGVLLINALAACERLILPVQCEHLAIKGLERMMRTLEMVMKSQRRELPYTIVPTMFDRRTLACTESLRILRQTYGEAIWPAFIPIDTRLRDASKAGVPPHQLDPNSRGVRAYASLLHYLSQQQAQAPQATAVRT